jgi:hypothetical protein
MTNFGIEPKKVINQWVSMRTMRTFIKHKELQIGVEIDIGIEFLE